jgi:hypothetical protein
MNGFRRLLYEYCDEIHAAKGEPYRLALVAADQKNPAYTETSEQ